MFPAGNEKKKCKVTKFTELLNLIYDKNMFSLSFHIRSLLLFAFIGPFKKFVFFCHAAVSQYNFCIELPISSF